MTTIGIEHSLGEVERSPGGPGIGAFFDLDGTLIAGFSAAVVLQHRLRNREVGLAEIGRTLRLGLDGALGRAGFEELLAESGRALEGRTDADLQTMAEQLFETKIAKLVYRDMRRLVEAHQGRSHTVVLASSATSYQVEPVAAALGIDHVVCNRMTVGDDGVLTGELAGPVVWGPGKAAAVQGVAAQLDVDLGRSWFYADGDEDAALMHLVGRPRPVNPRRHLEAVASRRGWPVLRVSGEPGPSLVGGLRRVAINTVVPRSLDLLFRASGVKVNVVTGSEHLRSPRPAVFIFNHRNNWDPFVTMSLVRTDVTGVAKKELARDLLFAPAARLLDVAFVDRSDTAAAVAALEPIEELARKGLSVVVAPEGIRSPTDEVLPFKKGAFRIAMATGLPIVPIVIRNAEVLGDRDSTRLRRGGTVDVAVLEPVSTAGWTLDDLPKRIDEVRQRYVDALARWPG